jgi:protein involved in polysaccharide export with SLBB domain
MIRASVLAAVLGGICLPLAAQNPPPAPPPAPVTQVVTPATPTAAQQAAQAMGKSVSNQQIADAIKNSGMSEQQIRDRLKGAGYDPSLADPFFAKAVQAGQAAAGGVSPTAAQANAFAAALSALGISGIETTNPESAEKSERPPEEDVTNRERSSGRAGGIFGKDVFAGVGTAFDPVTTGPVDPSFRVGVGDQLQVIVTGQVELAYALEIRRDGTVVIPQVGQIAVAGLTLDGARTALKARMERSYSGLATGEAQLDLSLSRIRSNSVFVIGEVERPGSYQVNALSTVFYALARAGGPTARGSFRRVELRRAGRLLRTIDLYDYLLRGDASNDLRTEQGDIIFVPLNTRAVAITGAVRRPAVFELKPEETFADLIEFAGSLLPTASMDRVQVDRVLPPERRAPGFDRVKLDVLLGGSLDSLKHVALYDNDIISVFSIGDLRRNTVTIAGSVFQPGEFEFTAGMTLDTLIARASGPLPWALTDRIKLRRNIVATGRTESFDLNLADSAARNFRLTEFDQVVVLDGRAAYPAGTIAVSGAVRRPFSGPFVEKARLKDVIDLADGFAEYAMVDRIKVERPNFETGQSQQFSIDYRTDSGRAFGLERGDRITVLDVRTAYPARTVTVDGAVVSGGTHSYVLNQSLKDAIDLAGGFTEEAQSVVVARRKYGPTYSDTTSTLYEFRLDAQRRLDAAAQSFVLAADDRVSVRAAPGFRAQRFVSLEGLFTHSGAYAITENRERLRDVVARAGGLLPGASYDSFRLTREGKLVGVDFARAMRGNRSDNVLLRAGDVLTIGADPRTVNVVGAVSRPSLLVFRPGYRTSDYIELAGGPTDRGQAKRAVVEYPSGFSKRVRAFLGIVVVDPAVASGSTISVPEKPESKTSSGEIWARVFGTASALASLVLAYSAITK